MNAEALDTPEATGAAKTGLDFVGDQECAVLVAQSSHGWEVTLRRHREAAPGCRFPGWLSLKSAEGGQGVRGNIDAHWSVGLEGDQLPVEL